MASKCFMCGREISQGILCEKCDKPRGKKPSAPPRPDAAIDPEPQTAAPTQTASPAVSTPRQPAASSLPPRSTTAPATAHDVDYDAFPEAPIVPFPVESASLAITSIVNVLAASGVPSVVVGPDRTVKFVSHEATRLFQTSQPELMDLRNIESVIGQRVNDISVGTTSAIRIGQRAVIYSLVPLSGGAGGAVLVFRPAAALSEADTSFIAYMREAALAPMKALRDSLIYKAASGRSDPILLEAAGTIDTVLSSLELAPDDEQRSPGPRPIPTVSEVVKQVADRFVSFAELKSIQLQVDAPEIEGRFRDHESLADALGILMDNALHYVPPSGQVVAGVRMMEHKGKPLILFFVMDNGPMVHEDFRQKIFDPGFVWNPSASERTGRSLSRCREFALAHGGQVWVESKTGKACTFFLRVRPEEEQ
ncbi:MAG TPA: ATP-binding protein [Thermoanaerobaculia bacterium]|nr:ATP-binding protein [Thermoanaerobaculia bacterium]